MLNPPTAHRLRAAALALGLGVSSLACSPEEPTSTASPAAAPEPGHPVFRDVTERVEVDFVHFNGMSGEHYFMENIGPGVALFDFDGDGQLDLFLVQGAMLGPGKGLEQATLPPPPGPLRGRLYRNVAASEGPGAEPGFRFEEVTERSGIRAVGYGMGVAVGDFTNNGFPDLYITYWNQANELWRNDGDGTFTEVTAQAGVGDRRWSTSATFADLDGDGWLDLYVANYVELPYSLHRACFSPAGRRDYCGPGSFDSVPDSLFRNRGDGTFADHSGRAGIRRESGKGLGVIAADLTGDGALEIFVANDPEPNFLWIAEADDSYRNDAALAGVAVNRDGLAEASMGVDAGDFNANGLPDLFMTHLGGETNTLYVNLGDGLFSDQSSETGIGPPSLPYTGFGTGWIDFDNDGWLDLLVVNGAVRTIEEQARAGEALPLREPNQLFRNQGDGTLVEVSARAGESFALLEVSRGAAFGDLDNDGAVDAVITNNAGPARVLRNEVGAASSWVGVRALGWHGRDDLGATVEVVLPDRPSLWRRIHTDGSYLSAHDPRLVVGLGDGERPTLRVYWRSGRVEEWSQVPTRRYLTLHEGSGHPLRDATHEPH